MSTDDYLLRILAREAVDTGSYSQVRSVQAVLQPGIQAWASGYLSSITPSGSFATGTANHSGTDIDLFISLHQNTPDTLKELYNKLSSHDGAWLSAEGAERLDQYPRQRLRC